MTSFRTLVEQLRALWLQTSKPARAVFVLTAGLCVAMIVGVGIWSSRPQFVPLASGLEPAETAEIVSKLDAEGIENKLNFAGSAVLVPKQQWNQARLVAGDRLGAAPQSGSDEFEGSLLGDPALNHYKLLRRREDALARSIMQMDAVNMATVHIGVPEPTPFVQEQVPTTASVILDVRAGVAFTQEQAAAVVAMVAAGVEGLAPDNVTVMDTRGRILTPSAFAADGDIASQFDYRRKFEADLAAKAEWMLAEMLGAGHAIVRVSADIDFTRTERTETLFDPDSKVKKSERIKTVSRTRSAATAAGIAGTASNLGGAAAFAGQTPMTETEEENDTEYENAKSIDTVKETGGTVKRLTIAAMVDLTRQDPVPSDPAQPAAAATAVPDVTKEQVEAIIKQAVGFDPQRSDQIEVLVTELAGATLVEDPAVAEAAQWQYYSMLARNSSLGLAAIVALILGLLILRKMRPIALPGSGSVAASAERAQILDELSVHARQNPEAMSRIIASWLESSGSGQESSEPESQKTSRAAA